MKTRILVIAALIIAVVTGAGGFFGGMVYAQGHAQGNLAAFQQQRAAGQNASGGAPTGNGQFRGGNGQLGAPVANGQIKSINGNTIEISTADAVVTVKVNDQTQITKNSRAATTDLQAGDRVTVFSKESGTTPTASGIQVQAALPQQQQ